MESVVMSLIISSSLIKMELLFGLFNANSASLSLLFSKSFSFTNTFVFLVTTEIFDVGISNEVLLLETVFKTSFLDEVSKVFLVFELLFFD